MPTKLPMVPGQPQMKVNILCQINNAFINENLCHNRQQSRQFCVKLAEATRLASLTDVGNLFKEHKPISRS